MDCGGGGGGFAAATPTGIHSSLRELWIPTGGKVWIRIVVGTGPELWKVLALKGRPLEGSTFGGPATTQHPINIEKLNTYYSPIDPQIIKIGPK